MRGPVVLFLSLTLAVVGCTRDAPKEPAPPAPAGWPLSLESFSFVWTAGPGIDLVTDGAAIASRAYVESYLLAVITENEKYLYPGFDDAVEPNQSGRGTDKLRPELGVSEPDIYIGTVRHHVLSITRSNREVTLTACAFMFGSAIEEPDGSYSAIVGDAFVPSPGIYPMRIGLRAPEDTQSKLPPQEGPARAPFDDVFAGWKITSQQGGYLSRSRWPDYDRDRATCIAIAEGLPGSQRVYPHVPSPSSEFPTLPANPGWPIKPGT